MSKINICPACNAERNGVKSRIAFRHTCGKGLKSKWPFSAHNQESFGAGFFHNSKEVKTPYKIGDIVYFNMAILPGPVISRRAVVVKVITDYYYEVEYERQGEKLRKRLIWSHLSPTP